MKFVTATLKSIEALDEEKNKNTWLNSINSETKFISMVIILFLMLILNSLNALLILLLFLVFESLVFERNVFKIWLFVPLFTGIIAIPAIFMTPGKPVIEFYFLTVTNKGLMAASYLLIRSLIAVTCVALFTKTTRWEDVIRSLRLLHLPRVLILILFLTFRYIFFFVRIIESTLLSVKSRIIGKEKSTSTWRIYSPLVGNLFVRTYEMQEKVYISMRARGFMLGDFVPEKHKIEVHWKYLVMIGIVAGIAIITNGDML